MTFFDRISELVKTKTSDCDLCFSVSDEDIEALYKAGTYHGIFSGDNSGFEDRRNSVYCFLLTLFEINLKP